MGRKKQSGTERSRSGNGANLGFEEKLWAAPDKMRGHMDAGEYKHVALGLIFLKYSREKGTLLNSASLAPKPVASSVYVRVPDAPSPLTRSISVFSFFPSGESTT